MAVTDVLKEYLVKVGFDVDNTTQRKVNDALKDINTSLNTLSQNKSFKILTGTATAFASVLTTVITSTVMLMNKTADADMEYQKIALRMHMTTQAAKQMTIAMEALGATFEEIAWNPELLARYNELRRLVGQAATPADASAQLRLIRDVGFEFTKLMTTMRVATEWITYHLGKMFGGEIKKIRDWLRNINKWLVENMPKWTEKIATFLGRFINIAKVVWDILKEIFAIIKGVVDFLPKVATGILAIGAAFAFLSMHPALVALRPIILGLIALFILLDDYATFKRARDAGKDSWTSFGPLWIALSRIGDVLGEVGGKFNKVLKLEGFDQVAWKAFASLVDMTAKSFALLGLGAGALLAFFSYMGSGKEIEKEYREELKEEEEALAKERKRLEEKGFEFINPKKHSIIERSLLMARNTAREDYDEYKAYMKRFSVFQKEKAVLKTGLSIFGNERLNEIRNKYREKHYAPLMKLIDLIKDDSVQKAIDKMGKTVDDMGAGSMGPTSYFMPSAGDTYNISIGNVSLPGVNDPTDFMKSIVMVAQEQRAVS